MDTLDQIGMSRTPNQTMAEGFVVLTAREAASLVMEHRHPDQTRDGKFKDHTFKRHASAEAHINSLAEIMRRGAWRDRGLIACARVNGRIILIDGYHRLHAQAQVGRDMLWTVAVYDCNPDEAKALFWTFDTVARKRTAQQVIGSTGLGDSLGLSRDMATAVWKAVPLIAANFSTSKTEKDTMVSRLPDLRADWVRSFEREAQKLDEWYSAAPTALKRRLMSAGRMAVALVTTKHQPAEAERFWFGIAQNDGLRRGDPRHTLVNTLLTKSANSNQAYLAFAEPAHAWNSAWHKRSISFIRIGRQPYVKIEGTPFTGSGFDAG